MQYYNSQARCAEVQFLLKGVRYEKLDKKIPARSITTTNRRRYPSSCSTDY